MTVTCPHGHQSEATDYCDQCGARIEGGGGAGAGASPDPASSVTQSAATPLGGASTLPPGPTGPVGAPSAAPPGSAPAPAGGAQTAAPAPSTQVLCPACQTPRVGDDRYCEGCGHDFSGPTVASPQPGAGGITAPPVAAAGWEAVATADREYFDRLEPEGVTFPPHCPPRTYVLSGDEIRIGRHSNSRGIQPEVDLSGAPEDAAISHLHCMLLAQPDGTYHLVDPGSTNGTTLNDDMTPLAANMPVALHDGDRIHLGAWTTLTIRARHGADPPAAP